MERFKLLLTRVINTTRAVEKARIGEHINLAAKLCDKFVTLPPRVRPSPSSFLFSFSPSSLFFPPLPFSLRRSFFLSSSE
jgi:hypothetical protein